jgi:hypothetical protein
MWCCDGLEYVGDVTAEEGKKAWAALKGEEHRAMPNLMHLRLRAQHNPQRHYEIYFIGAEEGIGEEAIRSMFQRDPQGTADLIRERGERFYSNRIEKTAVIV